MVTPNGTVMSPEALDATRIEMEMVMILRSSSQNVRTMFCIAGSLDVRKRTWFPTKMARKRFECKV
jgi:hypothetical protein